MKATGGGMATDELLGLYGEVTEAGRLLAHERKVPPEVHSAIRRVADTRERMSPARLQALDPYLVLALDGGLLAAWRASRVPVPEDERAGVRVALEQIRQALRDLLDDEPVSDTRPTKEVARWLQDVLDAPQHQVARLLGVSARQLQRWLSADDAAEPKGEDARRLRAVARLTAHLRHVFTGPGVLAWLSHPHPALDGAAPAALLDRPEAISRLRTLASAARSSAAA